MQNDKQIKMLVKRITATEEFWIANYYARSMKKAPHGMIEHVTTPNYYLLYKPTDIRIFYPHRTSCDIPYFLNDIIELSIQLLKDMQIDIEDVLRDGFCFERDWYSLFRLLKPKQINNGCLEDPMTLINKAMCHGISYTSLYEIDTRVVLYALIMKLIDDRVIKIKSIKDILSKEKLLETSNKYGLTDITEAEFMQQGFIINNTYYLYNIFLDISVADAFGKTPLTINLFQNDTTNSKIYMRCDNNLAVPSSKLFSTASVDAQLFRGISLDFSNLLNTINKKEIIVHYAPESFHKIVLLISKENEDNDILYQISVEELWNPENVYHDIVITSFIHGIFSLDKNTFLHIDFSVNQYTIDMYKAKFQDNIAETGIPIDKYADIHYKVWCIEGEIDIDVWGKLVVATLSEPFRELFNECINAKV